MLLSDPAEPAAEPAADPAADSPARAGVGPASRHVLPPTARLRLAQDALRTGRVREARDGFRGLLNADEPEVASPARAGVVDALLAQGEVRSAAGVLIGVDLRPRHPRSAGRFRSHDLHAAADLASAQGDPAAAVDLHHAAGALMDGPTGPPWRVGAAFALARVGRRGEAVALAREHHDRGQATRSAYDSAQALRVLAALDASGRRASLLAEARLTLAGVVAQRLAAQVDCDLAGLMLLGLGGPIELPAQQQAARLLGGVERYALAEGLWPLLGRVRRLLVASGTSAPWPHLERLTAAERRVVEPAAQGATNREIAAAAGISVKAVEWHLSRVYRKLGVTSRRALVDALGRR